MFEQARYQRGGQFHVVFNEKQVLRRVRRHRGVSYSCANPASRVGLTYHANGIETSSLPAAWLLVRCHEGGAMPFTAPSKAAVAIDLWLESADQRLSPDQI